MADEYEKTGIAPDGYLDRPEIPWEFQSYWHFYQMMTSQRKGGALTMPEIESGLNLAGIWDWESRLEHALITVKVDAFHRELSEKRKES